ncbi:MAG: energy-coupling factor transporter transmembrane protein EcfT [Verrucomicrobia bacterium]|nr:energy-coupling factor transporter transmembrane protein EcfT [Verrucomicrobiota bacterium]
MSDWLGHHHDRGKSVIYRMPAGLKLGIGLVIIVGCVVAPPHWPPWWFAGSAVVLGGAVLASRLPVWFLVKRLLLLSPFVFGIVLVNGFQPASRLDWRMLVVRSFLCLLTVILVSNTTPFSQILRVLQTMRVPSMLITTLALMFRYLFVLVDESERMRRARASRSFTGRRRAYWQTQATVISQLFVRASARAERIYDAMRARGWE